MFVVLKKLVYFKYIQRKKNLFTKHLSTSFSVLSWEPKGKKFALNLLKVPNISLIFVCIAYKISPKCPWIF